MEADRKRGRSRVGYALTSFVYLRVESGVHTGDMALEPGVLAVTQGSVRSLLEPRAARHRRFLPCGRGYWRGLGACVANIPRERSTARYPAASGSALVSPMAGGGFVQSRTGNQSRRIREQVAPSRKVAHAHTHTYTHAIPTAHSLTARPEDYTKTTPREGC